MFSKDKYQNLELIFMEGDQERHIEHVGDPTNLSELSEAWHSNPGRPKKGGYAYHCINDGEPVFSFHPYEGGVVVEDEQTQECYFYPQGEPTGKFHSFLTTGRVTATVSFPVGVSLQRNIGETVEQLRERILDAANEVLTKNTIKGVVHSSNFESLID